MLTAHSALFALAGGALIGASAALLYLLEGRIAGISGIWGGLADRTDRAWRLAFVLGLLAAGLAAHALSPAAATPPAPGAGPSAPLLAVAGLLVGFGARMGNGCTSGHGVCGLGRGSARSLSATVTFMATAAAVVLLTRHLLAGATP